MVTFYLLISALVKGTYSSAVLLCELLRSKPVLGALLDSWGFPLPPFLTKFSSVNFIACTGSAFSINSFAVINSYKTGMKELR